MAISVTVSNFSGGVNEYTNVGLESGGDYLLALCGRYALIAAGASGGGGAIVPSYTGNIISPIKITSADFADATNWNGVNSYGQLILPNYTLQVFWNDVNRFLEQGTEWVRTTNGVQILNNGTTITGFDASVNDYVFYIYISK